MSELQDDDKPCILPAVTTLKHRLVYFVDVDFGLLDQLLVFRALTAGQFAHVRNERTAHRRNDALLDLLTSEDRCRTFLKALQQTDQEHVVNFVTQNGVIGAEFGDVRPLDEARMRKLTVNGIQLVQLIDADVDFLTELATVGCITWPQRDHIVNIVQPRDRNDSLLDFLTRRSVADFKKFTKVLSKAQADLVPLLLTDGVVVGIQAELSGSSVRRDDDDDDDDEDDEDIIVSRSRALLPTGPDDETEREPDYLDEILSRFGLETKLVLMRRASGIVLYFICMTMSAVSSLRDEWRSRRLRDPMELLFTYILHSTAAVEKVTWPLTDYERCSEFFNSVQEQRDSDCSKTVGLSSVTALQALTTLSNLPLEMLELVLMRTFLLLYSTDFESDDDTCSYTSGKSRSSERRAFTLLASVCSSWHFTLTGWPQSPTHQWVRHQLKKLIECSCRPLRRSADEIEFMDVPFVVVGVTQLHEVVYMIYEGSSTIFLFDAETFEPITDIDVDEEGLQTLTHIASCERTSRVYVADDARCIWRVSSDGAGIQRWPPGWASDTFEPRSLSVTSTRLLVTSEDSELIQFDANGDELRRVQLQDHMQPRHAVESPTGTFIVLHHNSQLRKYQITEVNTGGQMLHQFTGLCLRSVDRVSFLASDSHGNILVADARSRRILLLDAHLKLRRIIIDEHQLNRSPENMFYIEQSGLLFLAFYGGIAMFDVLRC